MTTVTIAYNRPTPAMLGTDIQSLQEELFNSCWAEYFRRNALGFDITALPLSPKTAFKQPQNTTRYGEENISEFPQCMRTEPAISTKNLEAIRILNQWFAEPDDLGEEFWNEFCDDLEKNRFTI